MAFIVSRKNVIASQLGKVVSIILSILMIIVSINVEKSTSVLNQITNSDSQITRLNLIVMNDSGITKPEELSNKDIEYAYGESSEMKSGLEQLQEKVDSPDLSQVENVTDLADDLYDGNTDAIFVNEAYSSLLEDTHETFTNDTTIIYSIDIKEDVTDFAKQADVTNESFNIFISGIDTTGPVSTISRSDVNMVVTVNPVTKKILMTSIPRDYYVTLANLGQKDKLTHAGLGGVEKLSKNSRELPGNRDQLLCEGQFHFPGGDRRCFRRHRCRIACFFYDIKWSLLHTGRDESLKW